MRLLAAVILVMALDAIACGEPEANRELLVAADGSLPYDSVQTAVARADAGDTVIVGGGDYDERIRVTGSGEIGKPISILSAEIRKARVHGFDISGDNIIVRGFEITSDATGLAGNGVVITGDNVTVEDCYIHDMKEKGIIGHWDKPWAKSARIIGNRIYRCSAGIHATGDGWLVENNEIERLMQNTPKRDCDYMRVFGKDVTVRGNRFFGTRREEIGTAHVDGFQTYDNNGEYLSNSLFEKNVVMDCHQGFMAEGRKGGMHDLAFRDNVFARCWSWAMDMHHVKNVTIEHNLFADMPQHCIGFRPGSTGVIRSNIFYRAGSMFFADDGAEIEGGGNVSYQSSVRTKPLEGDRQANPFFGEDYRLTAQSPTDAGPQWYRQK